MLRFSDSSILILETEPAFHIKTCALSALREAEAEEQAAIDDGEPEAAAHCGVPAARRCTVDINTPYIGQAVQPEFFGQEQIQIRQFQAKLRASVQRGITGKTVFSEAAQVVRATD